MTASTSSTLRPTTAGTLVAGFPRGRFYVSPGTRVLSYRLHQDQELFERAYGYIQQYY